MKDEQKLLLLRTCVEKILGRQIATPKDFSFLSGQIYKRMNVMVSSTTLKRLWGYLKDGTSPRESTLSILARFSGYRDWKAFVKIVSEAEGLPQPHVVNPRKSFSYSLSKGDIVTLNWTPGYSCTLRYLGECNYEVLNTDRIKLQIGETFHCSILIEGESS